MYTDLYDQSSFILYNLEENIENAANISKVRTDFYDSSEKINILKKKFGLKISYIIYSYLSFFGKVKTLERPLASIWTYEGQKSGVVRAARESIKLIDNQSLHMKVTLVLDGVDNSDQISVQIICNPEHDEEMWWPSMHICKRIMATPNTLEKRQYLRMWIQKYYEKNKLYLGNFTDINKIKYYSMDSLKKYLCEKIQELNGMLLKKYLGEEAQFFEDKIEHSDQNFFIPFHHILPRIELGKDKLKNYESTETQMIRTADVQEDPAIAAAEDIILTGELSDGCRIKYLKNQIDETGTFQLSYVHAVVSLLFEKIENEMNNEEFEDDDLENYELEATDDEDQN